jgi:hypothetical protein
MRMWLWWKLLCRWHQAPSIAAGFPFDALPRLTCPLFLAILRITSRLGHILFHALIHNAILFSSLPSWHLPTIAATKMLARTSCALWRILGVVRTCVLLPSAGSVFRRVFFPNDVMDPPPPLPKPNLQERSFSSAARPPAHHAQGPAADQPPAWASQWGACVLFISPVL